MIDDSNEESYTIKRLTQEDEDEPDPHEEIPTPVSESTPYDGDEKGVGKMNSRPLTALKKQMWVQPESREAETEEEDRKSSDDESPASRRSPMSVVSSGRMMAPEHEVPLHLREPRAFGDRITRTHVLFNDRTGMRDVSSEMGGDEMLTGEGPEGEESHCTIMAGGIRI